MPRPRRCLSLVTAWCYTRFGGGMASSLACRPSAWVRHLLAWTIPAHASSPGPIPQEIRMDYALRARVPTVRDCGALAGAVLRGVVPNNQGLRLRVLQDQPAG